MFGYIHIYIYANVCRVLRKNHRKSSKKDHDPTWRCIEKKIPKNHLVFQVFFFERIRFWNSQMVTLARWFFSDVSIHFLFTLPSRKLTAPFWGPACFDRLGWFQGVYMSRYHHKSFSRIHPEDSHPTTLYLSDPWRMVYLPTWMVDVYGKCR